MKKYLKNLFLKTNKTLPEKRSLAEFFLHATPKEKEKVFMEAARKANEDQRKLLNLKVTS